MKRLLIIITGLLIIATVCIVGCTSQEETTPAPVSTLAPVTMTVQAVWNNDDLHATGTTSLPDGEVVIVEVYDSYVSGNIPDEPIKMGDGTTITYTNDGIYHTREAIVSNGKYETTFVNIGVDILTGDSLRIRTLYQESISNEVHAVK
jgi:hypothetical protein